MCIRLENDHRSFFNYSGKNYKVMYKDFTKGKIKKNLPHYRKKKKKPRFLWSPIVKYHRVRS